MVDTESDLLRSPTWCSSTPTQTGSASLYINYKLKNILQKGFMYWSKDNRKKWAIAFPKKSQVFVLAGITYFQVDTSRSLYAHSTDPK